VVPIAFNAAGASAANASIVPHTVGSEAQPLTSTVAVSVGIVGGVLLPELDDEEDVKAETDTNVVCTGDGRFVEVQGTAESQPFDRTELDALLGQVPQPGRRVRPDTHVHLESASFLAADWTLDKSHRCRSAALSTYLIKDRTSPSRKPEANAGPCVPRPHRPCLPSGGRDARR
jgi:hypothetical protein